MKTRFEVNEDIFEQEWENVDRANSFNFVYKHNSVGWKYDPQNEEYFIIFNKKINLQIGDMVKLGIFYEIEKKIYDLQNDCLTYTLKM